MNETVHSTNENFLLKLLISEAISKVNNVAICKVNNVRKLIMLIRHGTRFLESRILVKVIEDKHSSKAFCKLTFSPSLIYPIKALIPVGIPVLNEEANHFAKWSNSRYLVESFPHCIEIINGDCIATRDLMMSLNISESAKVVAILKQTKTISRVAKHLSAIAHLRFLMDFLRLQPNTRQSVIETHETPCRKLSRHDGKCYRHKIKIPSSKMQEKPT